jgi:hypothetical protein
MEQRELRKSVPAEWRALWKEGLTKPLRTNGLLTVLAKVPHERLFICK